MTINARYHNNGDNKLIHHKQRRPYQPLSARFDDDITSNIFYTGRLQGSLLDPAVLQYFFHFCLPFLPGNKVF